MPAVASQYLSRMAPVITERFEPEGTLLELFLKKNSDKCKVEETIMTYLADHSEAKHRNCRVYWLKRPVQEII